MNPNFWILGTAVGSLLIGLTLLLASRKSSNFQTINLISWLLVALFPVLIIFSDFPSSTISGSVLGFSATGAVALFIFIWWFGTKRAMDAVHIDRVQAENQALRDRLEKASQAKQEVVVAGAPKPISETRTFTYSLRKYPKKRIGLITGNIQGVRVADIWVNSENTNMQMSRFYERSVSGAIRYLGARKDEVGDVIEDLIMQELASQMKGRNSVQPTTVLVTGPGELATSHNVHKICHVAAVFGQVGFGYRPIDNLEQCVTRVLERTETLQDGTPLRSILFPLLGTGQGSARVEELVDKLLMAAISYLECKPDTQIQTIYFLAWTDRELQACQKFLDANDRVEKKAA